MRGFWHNVNAAPTSHPGGGDPILSETVSFGGGIDE
jgi:hypothetical protein